MESAENRVLGMSPEDIVAIAEREMRPWLYYVNVTTGIVAFVAAIVCASAGNPQLLSLICLIVIAAAREIVFSFRPEVITRLREKFHKTELERVVLKGIESELLGRHRSFAEAPALWVGASALIAIACGVSDILGGIRP
jgi:hypothetical protein